LVHHLCHSTGFDDHLRHCLSLVHHLCHSRPVEWQRWWTKARQWRRW
jgi:hypothetical protein